MMPFVFFSTTQNNLCSIHNHFVLTSLTLPENSGVGKIGKPKSRKRGWGGRISLFVLFYYNLRRWSKGVGVLGSPVVPRPPCLSLISPTFRLLPKPRQANCLLQAVLVLLLGSHHALSQIVACSITSGLIHGV